MNGHIIRHTNELQYMIVKGKIEGKRRLRTSLILQMISNTELTNYTKLKRLVSICEEWRQFKIQQKAP